MIWQKSFRLAILFLVMLFAPSYGSTAFSSNRVIDGDFPSLRIQTQNDGFVRVIVGLDIGKAFVPEGNLPNEQAREEQRRAIGNAQNAVLNAMSGQNFTIAVQFTYVPGIAFEVDTAALDKLGKLPFVTSIVEDKLNFPTLASSIPVIGADTAWAAGYDGSGQTIAIIDTGVDRNHPYLNGKVVSEACYSTNQTTLFKSLCPKGNSSQLGRGASDPTKGICGNNPGMCYHGTHVAGIAVSQDGTNTGVAPDADLISIQVFTWIHPSLCGGSACVGAFDSDIISGLQRVYALKDTFTIASVNMSLGGGPANNTNCDGTEVLTKAAIDNLKSVNIATIIASGNNGFTNGISSPACISSAISVGATTDGDVVTYFSNVGNNLDLFAPGWKITSSTPNGGLGVDWAGTSMAAPHVAGAWAVLREAFLDGCSSDITVDAALGKFTSTGVAVTDTIRSNGSSGSGLTRPRIQLDAAISECYITPAAPTNLSATDGVYPSKVRVNWDATVATAYYEVWRDTDAGGASKSLVTSPTNNSYNDFAVTDLTTYYYWMKACNSMGCSTLSTSNSGYSDLTAITEIFSDGFESGDTSAWIGVNTGDGDLYVCAAAAIEGGNGACVDVVSQKRKQVWDQSMTDETRYRARFYFDPNGLSMGDNEKIRLMQLRTGVDTIRPAFVQVRTINGGYEIRVRAQTDAGVTLSGSWYPISDASVAIEIDWMAATGPGNNDGYVTLWLDGVEKSTISAIDNDTLSVNEVKLGFTSRLGTKIISGTFYLDAFVSDFDAYIGLLP